MRVGIVADHEGFALHDHFSSQRGVEGYDRNVLCLGSQVVGPGLAWKLAHAVLAAHFNRAERHRRRPIEKSAANKGDS